MSQIIPITSESLQSQIRRLLPSQVGFGEDLQASNVILPTIDLTSAAQQANAPEFLQRAQAYGNQNAFVAGAGTTIIINNAGFWQITAVVNIAGTAAVSSSVTVNISDGTTDKVLYKYDKNTATAFSEFLFTDINFVVFLRAGDNINVISNDGTAFMQGSYRQVADVNGSLVNPVGFSPQ